MAWVKLDERFPDHPKVVEAGPLASWLYVCGLAYCNRYLTDGFIPAGQVRRLADVDGAQALADRLVAARLWEQAEGGYRVHDYLKYQPSRERSEATSAARSEAGSAGGKQRASNLLGAGLGDVEAKSNPVTVTGTGTGTHTEAETVVATQPHHAAAVRVAKSRSNRAAKRPPYTPAFEAFWQAYPCQAGRRWDKAEAFDGWLKAGAEDEDQAALLAGVAAWKLGRDWQKDYIKRPDRFLEGRLWADPPDPWAGDDEATPTARYRGQRGDELAEDMADFTANLRRLNSGRGDILTGDAQAPALALPGGAARQARQG